jgi:hypothetical protein
MKHTNFRLILKDKIEVPKDKYVMDHRISLALRHLREIEDWRRK